MPLRRRCIWLMVLLVFVCLRLQMAAPADAAGGSSDAFEVIRVHQVWPLAFLVGFGYFLCVMTRGSNNYFLISVQGCHKHTPLHIYSCASNTHINTHIRKRLRGINPLVLGHTQYHTHIRKRLRGINPLGLIW
jgi:hypothetical protein